MILSARFSRLCLLAVVPAAGWFSTPPVHAASPAGSIAAQPGGLTIQNAWARASAGAATTAAAYVTITGGAQADQLVAISTPVAATAGVHQSFTENGVMKMRAAPSLPVPAGQTVTFTPNGLHIMLMGLKQPLIAGQSFPMTFTFAQAAAVTIDVKVQPLGRPAPTSDLGPTPAH
jgi:periplasmic copper chaperone A